MKIRELSIQPTIAYDQVLLNLNEEAVDYHDFILSDLNGRIYPVNYTGKSANQIQLGVAALPSGYYTLRLRTNKEVWTGRFLKQ